MKTSKFLAILLALTMLAGMLSACGTPASSVPAEASAAAPQETPSAAPAAPEANPVPDSAAASELDAPEEPADPVELMKTEYITYPLEGEDNTISLWHYTPPYTQFVADNNDYFAVPYIEEATGVHIEFQQVSQSSVVEQFNLMVSTGDWADIIPAYEYYTGGLAKAYEEGVILDLNDYVDENMPNYADVVASLDEKTKNETLVDGMMLSFNTIADGTYNGNGLVTRGDWMDALGLEFSGNLIPLEELTELMRAMHSEYNTPYTYYLISDGQIGVQAAFDTEIPTLADSFLTTMSAAVYREDDTCMSGWTSDGYREYLEWLLFLFDEGIIYEDFLSLDEDMMVRNLSTAAGEVAVWQANADKIDELIGYSDDPDFRPAPIPIVTRDPDAPYQWLEQPSRVTHGMSVSATCPHVELVCQWMNFFWTYEGYKMSNYGVEGETFSMNDDGTFEWLDGYVVGDTEAPNAEMAIDLYTMKRFNTFYADHDRIFPTFTQTALDAVELWNPDDAEDTRNYPDAITFTLDEQATINEYQPDFLTYAQSEVLKFLDGAVALNDDTWASYVDTCVQMGLDDIVAVYQTAYDEYAAGKR